MKKTIIILICILLLTSCTNTREETYPENTISETNTVESTQVPTPVNLYLDDLKAHYIRTGGIYEFEEYPKTTAINSVEELYAFYEKNKNIKTLTQSARYQNFNFGKGFSKVAEKYNKDYFMDSSIVIVELIEGSGSIRHNVLGAKISGNNISLEVQILSPEIGAADLANWLIVVELPYNIDFDEINLVKSSKSIKPYWLDIVIPTVISGGNSVEIYEHLTYSKTYDEQTGKETIEKNDALSVEDIADKLKEIHVKNELNIPSFYTIIEKITIYNEAFETMDIFESFSLGQLLRYEKGTYYIKMNYSKHGNYNDIVRRNSYFEGEYFIKLVLGEEKYGIDKSLSELCGIDLKQIVKAQLNIQTSSDENHAVLVGGEDVSAWSLLEYLRSAQVSADLGKECLIDDEREIILQDANDEIISIMKTENGIFVDMQDAKYYLNMPPWCFEVMVGAIAGGLIIPCSDIIQIAIEDINKREYPISFEENYSTDVDLVQMDYGYKWLVTFAFPSEEGEDIIIDIELFSNGNVRSVRTNFDY